MFRFLFCILTFIAFVFLISFNVQSQNPSTTIQIAHRGASALAPENTLAAFDKAIELGADHIELDIQMSKDKKLIVIHDLTIDRTTNGNGYVSNLTLQEITKLDAGSWFGQAFSHSTIPTLEEIFLAYKGQANFILDIKHPEKYPGIEKQLINLLKKYHYDQELSHRVLIQSSSIPMIKKLHSSLPCISTGIVLNHFPTIYQLYSLKDIIDFVNVKHNYLTYSIINTSHYYGLKVFAWTVNNHDRANELMLLGVDGIVVDHPQFYSQKND